MELNAPGIVLCCFRCCSPAFVDKLVFLMLQDVPAGHEILISYLGDKPTKSNVQLMKDYGFVLPGNTSDQIGLQPTSKSRDLCSSAGRGLPPL